jgi:hypothetical protein
MGSAKHSHPEQQLQLHAGYRLAPEEKMKPDVNFADLSEGRDLPLTLKLR